MDKSNENSLFTCDACGASIATSTCPYCRAINQSLWEKEEEERKAKEQEKQEAIKSQEATDGLLYYLGGFTFFLFLASLSFASFLGSTITFLVGTIFIIIPTVRTHKRKKDK